MVLFQISDGNPERQVEEKQMQDATMLGFFEADSEGLLAKRSSLIMTVT